MNSFSRGWTLLELVLTITVTSILLSLIGTILYKPIQTVVIFNQVATKLEPMTLSMMTLKQQFNQPVLMVQQQENTFSFQSPTTDYQILCDKTQLRLLESDWQYPAVILDNFKVECVLHSSEQGWTFEVHLNDEYSTFKQNIHRVFYIPKVRGHESI